MVKRERDEEARDRISRERKPTKIFTHPDEAHRPLGSSRRGSSNSFDERKAHRAAMDEGDHKGQATKKPWSEEEDNLVTSLIAEYGLQRWRHIASFVRGRSGKQVRERWRNQLDPNLNKDIFTDEEDKLIVKTWLVCGNQWSEIARQLPRRTDNAVKNYWNSAAGKKMREKILGPDYVNVKPAITAPFKNAKKSILAKHAAMKKEAALRERMSNNNSNSGSAIATPPTSKNPSPRTIPLSPSSCPPTPLRTPVSVAAENNKPSVPKMRSAGEDSRKNVVAAKPNKTLLIATLKRKVAPKPAPKSQPEPSSSHSCSFVTRAILDPPTPNENVAAQRQNEGLDWLGDSASNYSDEGIVGTTQQPVQQSVQRPRRLIQAPSPSQGEVNPSPKVRATSGKQSKEQEPARNQLQQQQVVKQQQQHGHHHNHHQQQHQQQQQQDQQPATKRARFGDAVANGANTNTNTPASSRRMGAHSAMYATMQDQQMQQQHMITAMKMASSMPIKPVATYAMPDASMSADNAYSSSPLCAASVASWNTAANGIDAFNTACDGQQWLGMGTSSAMDFLGDDFDPRQVTGMCMQQAAQQWRMPMQASQQPMSEGWWDYLSV